MRGSWRRRVLGGSGALLGFVACTYDFDEYVDDGAASAGQSASGAVGGGLGGEAGAATTPAGGITGGAAGGGSGGRADPGGQGGAAASGEGGEDGEDAGAAGTGNGGSASGGSATGGASATNGGSTNGGSMNGGSTNGGSTTSGASGGSGASGALDCDAASGTVFGGHCYFYLSSLLDWSSASAACAEESATLVAVNSAEEQRFLESTFFAPANDAWIGLSLAALAEPSAARCKATPSSCPFEWQTGEPLSYTNWGNHSLTDSEPNYTGACVRIQGDTLDWADLGCTERVRAICEAE